MRTKALLCAAGLLAVGAVSALAQSNVYSLNVVGYVNVSLTNGFNLIANQLDVDGNRTNNTIAGVFSTNFPNLTKVYGYNTAGGTFGIATYASGSATWVGGQPSVNNGLAPGAGVWVQIPGTAGTPTPLTLTEVGNVVQGTYNLPVSTGFQIMSLIPPVSGKVKTDFGYPAANLDKIYQYNAVTRAFTIHTYASATGAWTGGGEPTPAVGEAFWVQSTGAKTWTQTFTVQ
jgi:hypothetical protein